jgi:hypothetical protein
VPRESSPHQTGIVQGRRASRTLQRTSLEIDLERTRLLDAFDEPISSLEGKEAELIEVSLDDERRDAPRFRPPAPDDDPERFAILKLLAKQRYSGDREAKADELQGVLFGQLQKLCTEILRRYPPSRFFYLGLGRSPAPLIAYFQEQSRIAPDLGIKTANLPIGGIKGVGSDHVQLRPFSSAEKRNLFAFFEDYLDTGIYGAKTVLLIDFVESGSGLKVAERLLKKFAGNPTTFSFITGNMDIKVQTLALYPVTKYTDAGQLRRTVSNYRTLGFDTIDIPGNFHDDVSLAAFLPNEVYKPLAEYYSAARNDGKFTLNDVTAGLRPQRSDAYDGLRKRIRRRLG